MSDESLRDRERRARETGSLADEAALLVERVRAGTLPRGRLELLAKLGHPPARAALGQELVAAEDVPELAAFRRALAETIAWWETREPASLFRSRELWPDAPHDLDPAGPWESWVDALVRRRAALVREDWLEGVEARCLGGGRLIIFDPSCTLTDGAATPPSRGYFDWNNVPAWDAWVAWLPRHPRARVWEPFQSYLVAWAPSWLLDSIAHGIDVNPENCILWAEMGPDDPFRRSLARAGFL